MRIEVFDAAYVRYSLHRKTWRVSFRSNLQVNREYYKKGRVFMNYMMSPHISPAFQTRTINSSPEVESANTNRLEALKVLSQSLLREVEAMRKSSRQERTLSADIESGMIDLDRELQRYEVELIRCALVRTGGRQRRAAKLLNVKISTLNAKIKRFGIPTSGLDYSKV